MEIKYTVLCLIALRLDMIVIENMAKLYTHVSNQRDLEYGRYNSKTSDFT